MIEHSLDAAHSILHLRPTSALEQEDFVRLARTVDPYIEATGDLAGLIIEIRAFPGWDSLGAMAAHFRFVRDHHKHVKKIAVVSATIRHFPAGHVEAARQWIMNRAAAA